MEGAGRLRGRSGGGGAVRSAVDHGSWSLRVPRERMLLHACQAEEESGRKPSTATSGRRAANQRREREPHAQTDGQGEFATTTANRTSSRAERTLVELIKGRRGRANFSLACFRFANKEQLNFGFPPHKSLAVLVRSLFLCPTVGFLRHRQLKSALGRRQFKWSGETPKTESIGPVAGQANSQLLNHQSDRMNAFYYQSHRTKRL